MVFISVQLNAQNDGPKFQFTGDVTGSSTIGLQGNDQAIQTSSTSSPSGIYISKKNSYYTNVTLNLLFNPVSSVDVYTKFRARHRPGSPYIPLQLAQASAEAFSFALDSAYGRVNVIKGLGIDNPLDLYIKVGKYDTAPSSFQNLSRHSVESVLSKLRTNNVFAVQLEAVYPLHWADSVGLAATTNLMFNEQITRVNGSTGETIDNKFEIPLHISLKFKKIKTALGNVSAEFLYVHNAEDFYSGNNFGLDAGWEIKIPSLAGLTIPVGFGFVFYEKNIDPFATAALDTSEIMVYLSQDPDDQNTTSFRRALRAGFAAGLRWNPGGIIRTELNTGFSASQVAHAYRETINVCSLAFDMRLYLKNVFFFGGGMYLGTLSTVEWKTNGYTDPAKVAYSPVFRPKENLGYEVFTGIQFKYARFVLGYNCNRGLAMGHTLESVYDGQIKYMQKGSSKYDYLFETGGIYTRLTISW